MSKLRRLERIPFFRAMFWRREDWLLWQVRQMTRWHVDVGHTPIEALQLATKFGTEIEDGNVD